jgi:hypothetical protein
LREEHYVQTAIAHTLGNVRLDESRRTCRSPATDTSPKPDKPTNHGLSLTKENIVNLYKRFFMLPALLAAAIAAGPSIHAQAGMTRGHDDEACRSGAYNPIVGIWSGNLDFTTLGKATVLVSINQGGTFTETDSVDLDGTVGNASPGYAAWKAEDCQHYTLTIHKTIWNPKEKVFLNVILPGTIVLSEDGQSWTVNLKQITLDANGNEVPGFQGTVTGSTKRINAGSAQ